MFPVQQNTGTGWRKRQLQKKVNMEKAIRSSRSPQSLWLGLLVVVVYDQISTVALTLQLIKIECKCTSAGFLFHCLFGLVFLLYWNWPHQLHLKNGMVGLLSTSKNLSRKTTVPETRQSKPPTLTLNFTSVIRNHKEIGSYEKHGTILWEVLIVICL